MINWSLVTIKIEFIKNWSGWSRAGHDQTGQKSLKTRLILSNQIKLLVL